MVEGPVVAAPRPVDQGDTVAILDFGSQYTQLIARRVRELGVYCEMFSHDTPRPDVERIHPRAFVLSGGPNSVYDPGAPSLPEYVLRSGLPVLGVLPYREDLPVPPEDSLSLDAPAHGGPLDVAVVRYPRISNFDDLSALAAAGAGVRYVREPAALGAPDLVVLPGSKSTLADLEWLRASGLGPRVVALADAGVPLIGICGGFQMLGRTLADPSGVDGSPGEARGLGLLPVRTTFAGPKRTVPVTGRVRSGGAFAGLAETDLAGYELHVGETERDGAAPFAELVRPDGERVTDGAVSADGRILGTYVHGLFGVERVRESILGTLARRRGLTFQPRALPPDPYGEVARWFRGAVDLAALLRATGLTTPG